MRTAIAALSVVLVAAGAAPPSRPVWLTDFPKAAAQSKSERRDLFVAVLGLEWSAESRAFRTQVLRASGIERELAGQFVLLELDRPEMPKTDPKQAPNREFEVRIYNYPAVVLLDSEGRCYCTLQRPSGGPAGLREALREAQAKKQRRDAQLARASQGTPNEQADALSAALEIMGRQCLEGGRQSHRPLYDRLVQLDPQDRTGTQRRFTFSTDALAERELWPLLREKKYPEALALVDRQLADLRNDANLRQRLLGLRFHVFQQQGNLEEAVKVLRQIIAVDDSSDLARSAQGYIDHITRPIALAGPEWKPEHLRFFFAEWRLDVSKQIAAPGRYRIEFRRDGGESIEVREVLFMAGESELAKAVPAKGLCFDLVTPQWPAGSRIWLKIFAKGQGWFSSRGTIVIEAAGSASPSAKK